MKGKNAQLSSIDIIISVIAIMLFISIVIVYFSTISSSTNDIRLYRTAILDLSPLLNGYDINVATLSVLQMDTKENIRNVLLAPIGLDNSQFDVCVVLKKGTQIDVLLEGNPKLGDACDNPKDICPRHTRVNSYIKPVLYDNQIYELNMLVCEP